MSIEITARHLHISPELQDYARGKAAETMEAFSRVEHIHVILDHQKHLFMAEVVVQAKPHARVEAVESTDNMRASIDTAFDKTERQLRKLSEKIHEHRL
jgi:putative sigma-54 modulation protein